MGISFEHDKHVMLWNELAIHPLKSKYTVFEELHLEADEDAINHMMSNCYGCYACKYAMEKNFADNNYIVQTYERNCIEYCPLDYDREKVYEYVMRRKMSYSEYRFDDGDFCLAGLFAKFMKMVTNARNAKIDYETSIKIKKPDLLAKAKYGIFFKKASKYAEIIRDLPVLPGVQIKK